jgi:hypothetical protein
MIIASILVGLLNGLQQQVERWRQEWVQLRRDDPGRVLGSLHDDAGLEPRSVICGALGLHQWSARPSQLQIARLNCWL